MNLYLLLKTVHILSSVLLVGTGFGSAFYLFFAHRSRSVPAIAVVARLVVRADAWFTTPAVIFQPLSGLYLAHLAGWPWTTSWIALSLGLFVIAGVCWLPVVWLQWRMAAMAEHCLRRTLPLPGRYRRYARFWEWLGYPAFAAMLAVYWLMVAKPVLW